MRQHPSRDDLWREVQELFDFYNSEQVNDATTQESVAVTRRTQEVWVEVQNRFATKDPELLRAVAELLYEATGDILGELFVYTGTGIDTEEWTGYAPLRGKPSWRSRLWRSWARPRNAT